MCRYHQAGSTTANEDDNMPLLTKLFFFAHSALRLAFPTLLALHFETNRQLHQWEQEAILRSPTGELSAFFSGSMLGSSPDGEFVFCQISLK